MASVWELRDFWYFGVYMQTSEPSWWSCRNLCVCVSLSQFTSLCKRQSTKLMFHRDIKDFLKPLTENILQYDCWYRLTLWLKLKFGATSAGIWRRRRPVFTVRCTQRRAFEAISVKLKVFEKPLRWNNVCFSRESVIFSLCDEGVKCDHDQTGRWRSDNSPEKHLNVSEIVCMSKMKTFNCLTVVFFIFLSTKCQERRKYVVFATAEMKLTDSCCDKFHRFFLKVKYVVLGKTF